MSNTRREYEIRPPGRERHRIHRLLVVFSGVLTVTFDLHLCDTNSNDPRTTHFLMIRRSALLPTLALAACGAIPASASAAPTQVFNAGAELLNQPAGAPWNINLLIGATFGTDDGSAVSPITHMKMSFPTGARFNGYVALVVPPGMPGRGRATSWSADAVRTLIFALRWLQRFVGWRKGTRTSRCPPTSVSPNGPTS